MVVWGVGMMLLMPKTDRRREERLLLYLQKREEEEERKRTSPTFACRWASYRLVCNKYLSFLPAYI